jgi:hypothetical protein
MKKCRTDLSILPGNYFKISTVTYNTDQNPAKKPNTFQIFDRRYALLTLAGDSHSGKICRLTKEKNFSLSKFIWLHFPMSKNVLSIRPFWVIGCSEKA